MPYFYILRIQREDSSEKPATECQVKFFPIFTKARGIPVRLFAETENLAFALAAEKYPNLRRYLAIQECVSYDLTIAGLLKAKYTRGVLRGAENARLGTTLAGASGVSVVAGDSGISHSGKRRPDENPVEAQPVV